MIGIGCAQVAPDRKVQGQWAVRLPFADGQTISYSCDDLTPAVLDSAARAYWPKLTTKQRRQAFATSVEGWWQSEEPVILDPPTPFGHWEPSSPTFQVEGYGWDIPEWTTPYYCEVMLFGDPWFMVKCWSWVEEDAPEGGGGGGPGGPSSPAALQLSCNHAGKKRGDEMTCTVTPATGTITSAYYSFVGSGGRNASGTVPQSGGEWKLTGPLLLGGMVTITGQIDSADALSDSVTVTVASRSPNPIVLGTGTGAITCTTFTEKFGWVSPVGTCEPTRWISPNPANDVSGINAICATSGINTGICYVTDITSGVYLGYGIAPELTGAGSFNVAPTDWTKFGCPPGGSTTNWGPPNDCGGGPIYYVGHKTLAQRAAITTAHELCHMTKSFEYASSSEAKEYLDEIEKIVTSSTMAAKSAANMQLQSLNTDINNMNISVVHAEGSPKWIWTSWRGSWGGWGNSQKGGEAC